MRRKCEACPAEVMAVCRHAFGKYWGDKSTNGEGCDFHLDDVAEAWRAKGWTPGTAGVPITLPLPKMPTRPRRPTVSKIQSGLTTRPKVSAALMRQAELFFGRADR